MPLGIKTDFLSCSLLKIVIYQMLSKNKNATFFDNRFYLNNKLYIPKKVRIKEKI